MPLIALSVFTPVLVVVALELAAGAFGGQALRYMLADRLHGGPGSILASLGFALRRLPRAFLAMVRVFGAAFAGALLLVGPGLWLIVRFAFVQEVVTFQPRASPLGATWTLSRDRLARIGLVLLGVYFVAWMLGAWLHYPAFVQRFAPDLMPGWFGPDSRVPWGLSMAGRLLGAVLAVWVTATRMALYLSIRAEPKMAAHFGPVQVPWAERAP